MFKKTSIIFMCTLLIFGAVFIKPITTNAAVIDLTSWPVSTSTYKVGTVSANGGLNVRQAPWVSANKIGSLSNGESVMVRGWNANRDWYMVEYHVDGTNDTKLGWVSSQFIKTN